MGDVEQLLLQEHYEEAQLARALLDRYYETLFFLAYSILGDSAGADDVVQETLLAALNKIHQYQPGTNLKAWLSRIAVNHSRDVLRKRKVRKKWYQAWSRVAQLGAPPRGPERHTADHELAGELWQEEPTEIPPTTEPTPDPYGRVVSEVIPSPSLAGAMFGSDEALISIYLPPLMTPPTSATRCSTASLAEPGLAMISNPSSG